MPAECLLEMSMLATVWSIRKHGQSPSWIFSPRNRSSRMSHQMNNGTSHIYQDEDADHFYYFAYGSNLLTERVHLLNPSAVYVCNGVLTGYRLAFRGPRSRTWGGSAATITEDGDQVVCGVVWKLRKEHSGTLDLQESHYRRLYVGIKMLPAGDEHPEIKNGYVASLKAIRCRTYQMIVDDADPDDDSPCLPSPHYKRVILCGAEEHKLPLEYRKKLEAVPDNGYEGPVLVRLSIFENWEVKKTPVIPTDL